MGRRVKEYVEISDHTSLDMLIKTLSAIRDTLPPGALPEMKMNGDDVFGRRLSVCYMRELTPEEAAIEARYIAAQWSADSAEIERLERALDAIPSPWRGEERRHEDRRAA